MTKQASDFAAELWDMGNRDKGRWYGYFMRRFGLSYADAVVEADRAYDCMRRGVR